MKYHIKDIALNKKGRLRIEWADENMPVLKLIREKFKKERPLKAVKISCCLHVTTESANLLLALKAGGADCVLCASNPLSTQDDVAASLVKDFKIPVFAIKGETSQVYYKHIDMALDHKPNITMDDGADLVSTIHQKRRDLIKGIFAGTEETTTGVIRLKSLESKGLLLFPIIAVNDANSKHLFDNRYGTGQSTIDGIIRATNKLIAGTDFVISGYGWCGKGVAQRAKGMGANVIVTEVEPLRALEAVMDGFKVMPIEEASKIGDIFVTLTGDCSILRAEHFRTMKDGAILCNSGHFNVEIDIPALEKMSKRKRRIREYVDEYTLKDGKRINLLGEGRLINLAAAEGHPAQVMDMSFANQALCAEFIKLNVKRLQRRVYSVPKEIDEKVASLKLKSMKVAIDELTPKQKTYLSSWELGT
ncbi:MAG: adenosylhomocysteinase [Candidatus Omnitrophota bacterium]